MAHPPLTRTPDQLDAILRAESGSLLETPYPLLLLALAHRERTAILTLLRGPLQKEIVFHEGAPIDCDSNIATETFGRFLVSSGKISEQDFQSALSLSASKGVTFEEILTEQKKIAAPDLERLQQQSLGRKLLEPFSWKTGTFELSFDDVPADSSLRVKVPQLVVTGILKVETQDAVDEAVAFARNLHLGIAPIPLFDLNELRLSTDQEKIVDAARSGKRLSEVAASTGIDADDVNRIVYALLLLGAITVTEAAHAAPLFELDNPFRKGTMESALPPLELPPAPVSPKPEPPKAEAVRSAVEPQQPVMQGVPPATAQEVLALHASYREKDPFDLLGVSDMEGPLQFQRAFLQLADRFLPSKFDTRAPDGLRDKAQEIFLACARAYAELVDPVRRQALLSNRFKKPAPATDQEATLIVPTPTLIQTPPEKVSEKAPPKPAERRAKKAVIDPELLCENGRELAEAGKLREALSSFEMAAECDAQNGTYAAEVAWCRFRLQVSPGTTTLKMLKNAIRIDPRSGLANLYAGKVAAALGNRDEAAAFLNRAAMLMPRDMRVVEALKSLR
jgi:hypothetical protein